MIVINSAGVDDDDQLRHQDHHGQAGEFRGHGHGQPEEELDHQDQHAAEHRLGHAGRRLPVAQQVLQPEPHVQPLALAKQHRFLVELIDRPANRQQAAQERHADDRHDEPQGLE